LDKVIVGNVWNCALISEFKIVLRFYTDILFLFNLMPVTCVSIIVICTRKHLAWSRIHLNRDSILHSNVLGYPQILHHSHVLLSWQKFKILV